MTEVQLPVLAPHPFGRILSDSHIAEVQQRFPRLSQAIAGGEKWLGAALSVLETAGVAGLMSYFNAKSGKGERAAVEIVGVPADLVMGLLTTGFSAVGYFGELTRHSQNIGAGLLSAYSSRMGTEWGRAARQPGIVPIGVRGYFPQPPSQSAYPPPPEQQPQPQQQQTPTYQQPPQYPQRYSWEQT